MTEMKYTYGVYPCKAEAAAERGVGCRANAAAAAAAAGYAALARPLIATPLNAASGHWTHTARSKPY